tara:strand:+ start:18317 stop:18709 length:393 start_codon:yes stop_codon:yes gene_type:complete
MNGVERVPANQDQKLVITPQTSFSEFIKKTQWLPERSKFVYTKNKLTISSSGSETPSQKELLADETHLTSGHISFAFDNEGLSSVKIDNNAGELCPSFASLTELSQFLSDNFYLEDVIELVNRPNLDQCE